MRVIQTDRRNSDLNSGLNVTLANYSLSAALNGGSCDNTNKYSLPRVCKQQVDYEVECRFGGRKVAAGLLSVIVSRWDVGRVVADRWTLTIMISQLLTAM